jgi:hypothetical protein
MGEPFGSCQGSSSPPKKNHQAILRDFLRVEQTTPQGAFWKPFLAPKDPVIRGASEAFETPGGSGEDIR